METLLKFFLRLSLFSLFLYLPLSLSANQQQETTNQSLEMVDSHWLKTSLYSLFKPVAAKPYWYVQTSVFTQHFSPKPEHNNNQKLIGIERNRDDSYLWGAATFLNSFEQRSYYAYVGKRFDFGQTPFYSKITGGLIHGYKGEYQHKIPFNDLKTAPVILPSLGVKIMRVQGDIILLGANAVTVTIGIGI